MDETFFCFVYLLGMCIIYIVKKKNKSVPHGLMKRTCLLNNAWYVCVFGEEI